MGIHRNAFVLRLETSDYPPQLRTVLDPPKVLYGIGDPGALVTGLAVIGARRSTPYGIRAAQLFAGWAGRAGYTVISGAARGCDQSAQQAVLDVGGLTVAVLGCGADVDYPASSASLLRRLRDGEGAVVSETPWGSTPMRWAFPRRNRIIAGLSAAVLVVEAGLPSGTFSTADHALDASRDVFVVPGSIFAPECRGSNRLLRQGATPITDVSELAQAVAGVLGEPPSSHSDESDGCSPENLMRALTADPMRPDDIARTFGLDIVQTMRRIGALEASGRVQRYPDGRFGALPAKSKESGKEGQGGGGEDTIE